MDDPRLAQLLCTRLCHDLVGPVGAVNNGVELLAESSRGLEADVVELIEKSAGELARRLKFFRTAFGLPAPSGERGGLDNARRLAGDFLDGGKVALDWAETAVPAVSAGKPGFSQLVLNLVLCGSEMLPRGGRLAVGFGATGDDPAIRVSVEGPAIKLDDSLLLHLAGEGDIAALDARGVQPHFTARLAAGLGLRLNVGHPTPDSAEITART